MIYSKTELEGTPLAYHVYVDEDKYLGFVYKVNGEWYAGPELPTMENRGDSYTKRHRAAMELLKTRREMHGDC